LYLPNIPANSQQTFDYTDSLYYKLLLAPSQYKFSGHIYCDRDSLANNNNQSMEFTTFRYPIQHIVIENMLEVGSQLSENILTAQQSLIDPDITEIINYYPDSSDLPFFCTESYHRLNYYDLIGLPATMLHGAKKILGYTSQYSDLFTENYAACGLDSTFISDFVMNGYYKDNGYVRVDLEITNEETKVFLTFLNNCSVYVLVVEDVIDHASLPGGFTIPVLRDIPAQLSAPSLAAGSTYTDSVEFDYQLDFTTIGGDIDNCRVVALLQNDETQQIYGVASINFTDFQLLNIEENEFPTGNMSVSIFPNPFKRNGNMRIDFDLGNYTQSADLKIYNIKGQLVKELKSEDAQTLHTFYWNGADKNNKAVASGIYLLKASVRDGSETKILHKKCLLIK
nr:FlgD immunoglobulin-like domain containing protein [Candidatus Cloacimonadota bacterium]